MAAPAIARSSVSVVAVRISDSLMVHQSKVGNQVSDLTKGRRILAAAGFSGGWTRSQAVAQAERGAQFRPSPVLPQAA